MKFHAATVCSLFTALLVSLPASAELTSPQISVGVTAVKTYFDDSFACILCTSPVELEDDEDAGVELFVRFHYSSWLGWELGYVDAGEFSYSGRYGNEDAKGTGEVSVTYVSWAPQWVVADNFSLGFGLGWGIESVDINNDAGSVDVDDGGAFYYKIGAEYKFSDNFAIHTKAAYVTGEDIDVGWVGLGGSYFF
ncbi:outer membrane beta-barrel protein [Corallincola platygyrae]|uniref:Outer membrane beta-barrel protein n=1 Tax=Corallincola platygyrae TaxID=1193278 RepID=A0ABW4XP82_9GAMM